MQSYFTIISANIRPDIDEKISIGLLLVCGERVLFNFSKEKLHLTNTLLSAAAHKYVKDIVKQIATEAAAQNKKKASLFEDSDTLLINPAFSLGYISYLTKYSNSILNFSEPKNIDKKADAALFQFLFKKYIDEKNAGITNPQRNNRFDTIKTKFYPKINKQYNIETKVSSKEIPNLIVPVIIDLIGINKKVIYAQTVDLERGSQYIQTDIGKIATLNQAYDNKAISYIISSEPSKKNYPEQHETWINIRKSKLAEYIDISEVDKLKEYADKHHVKPLVATE